MAEDSLLHEGMPVDLITAPGDIRKTSILQLQADDQRITLNQTLPPLDDAFLNRSLLITFKRDGAEAKRFGFKALVVAINAGQDEKAPPGIVVERGEAIHDYELRKYPRFNPVLFDRIQISFDENVMDIADISAGGARGCCQRGNLQHLNRGDIIRLTVEIGNQNHHVEAQVMRINHAIKKGGHWELAVAFMQWDRPLADALEDHVNP